jgi:hypothetical protein
MMFLGAFLVFERMVVLKKQADYEHVDEEDFVSTMPPVPLRVKLRLKYINTAERTTFVVTVLVHCGILVWAVIDLWSLRPSKNLIGLWASPLFEAFNQFSVLFSTAGFAVGACGMLYLFCAVLQRGGLWRGKRIVEAFGWFFLFAVLANIAVWMPFICFTDDDLFSSSPWLNIPLFALTFPGPVLLGYAIRRLCLKYPMLSTNVLLLPEGIRPAWSLFKSAMIFTFFIVSLTVCSLFSVRFCGDSKP